MASAFWPEHKSVTVDDLIELVTARHGVEEDGLEDDEHLVSAYAGSSRAQLAGVLHKLPFRQLKAGTLLLAHRVITFAGLAKQSAQAADTRIGMPEPKVVYCLAPAFFSKSMPYCSLPIFSTSCNASLRSSEYARALRKRAFSAFSLSSSLNG